MGRLSPLFSMGLVAAVTVAMSVGVSGASAEATSGEAPSAPIVVADGFVAFYFHGNFRCATCRKIEAYADEAIHSGFDRALEDGTLAWSVVNVDEPANKHFIEDFRLVTRSLVLVEYRDGEIARWKNLDQVWQLVRSKGDFVEYVQNEACEFLGTN